MKALSPLIKNCRSKTWAHILALPCIGCVSQESSPPFSGPCLYWLVLSGLWLDFCPSHLTSWSVPMGYKFLSFKPSGRSIVNSTDYLGKELLGISVLFLPFFSKSEITFLLFFFFLSIPFKISTFFHTTIIWIVTFASAIIYCLFFCFNACASQVVFIWVLFVLIHLYLNFNKTCIM